MLLVNDFEKMTKEGYFHVSYRRAVVVPVPVPVPGSGSGSGSGSGTGSLLKTPNPNSNSPTRKTPVHMENDTPRASRARPKTLNPAEAEHDVGGRGE